MITRDLVHYVGHSPVFKILLQTENRVSIMASPPTLNNAVKSADMLSTPADFPIFSVLTEHCFHLFSYDRMVFVSSQVLCLITISLIVV